MSERPSIPAKLRICGLTKMMYDMTMKVVTPAIVSRPSVVPLVGEAEAPLEEACAAVEAGRSV